MMRFLLVCVALLATACGGTDTPVAPTPPPVAACQANNTGTVFFENRSATNLTYDIIWDGSKLTTVSPGQNSVVYTFSAGIQHALRFQFTNTQALACNAGTPILTTCAATFYSCTG